MKHENRSVAIEATSTPMKPVQKVLLAGEVLILYGRARWLMRRLETPEVVERLRGDVQDAYDPAVSRRIGYRLGTVVLRTLDPLPADSRCLVRSLVLTALLARRGVRAVLVIGVLGEPEFAAHAWVEHGGKALVPAGRFERLVEL